MTAWLWAVLGLPPALLAVTFVLIALDFWREQRFEERWRQRRGRREQ